VIVIDDGSSDQTQQVVSRYANFVRCVRNSENLGIALTYNRGLKLARGEFVMFLACDCALTDPDFINSAVRHFADPTVGAVTGRAEMTDFPQRDSIDRVFAVLNRLDLWGDDHAVVELNFVENRCDVFRGDLLRSLGGLNGKLKRSNEDQDLSIRIQRAGYRLIQDRGLRFALDFGGTADSLCKQIRKQASYGRGQAYIALNYGIGEQRGLWNNTNRLGRLVYRGSQVVFTLIVAALVVGGFIWPSFFWAAGVLTAARGVYYFFMGRRYLGLGERLGSMLLGPICDLFYGMSFLTWLMLWNLHRKDQDQLLTPIKTF
jgi:glycosyltransferase involved in cell wall biosynthesis